jgi:DNA helicase II / ATP-dependent DNA helicase PcrA
LASGESALSRSLPPVSSARILTFVEKSVAKKKSQKGVAEMDLGRGGAYPPGDMPEFRIDDLNPEQLRAATAGKGPVLIIAGAGTGKTMTLASRVAWLVSQGIDPGRIMLLTFTRRASSEMLRRAGAALGETESRMLGSTWGGTFHSVACRLLRAYGEAIGLDPNFTVMDQSDAEDLMDMCRHDHNLASTEKRFPRKQTCLSIYSRCINSSDPLDHTLAAFFPWCIEWEQKLRLLFKSYTEAKQERHVLDYDDLLLYWFHLLGDETLVALLNERFHHILVDEYQDTNRLQSSILRRMRSINRNLSVVGDDAQSIYSFRAAEVRNILDFPAEFPGTTVVTLETNYRSTQQILDASNRVIGLSRKRHAKELRSVKRNGPKPTLVTCEREEDQTDFVVEKVLEHNESGLGLRRQAILVRAAHWSDHLEVELTRRNIPYRKYGGLKFLEAAHIKDLMSFLRVLENPRDQLAWTRILRLLEGVGPAVAERVCKAFAESGDVSALELVPVPAAVQAGLAKLADLIRSLSRKDGGGNVASDIERIRAFYDPLVDRLYENPDPRKRDLEQLEQISSAYSSRQAFLSELTLDPPQATGDLAGPPSRDDDWLTVSTIHSAKGCEWDAVYVIHASDGILPSDMATGNSDQIEEERRLLYVACTRAKEHLYVVHPLRYYVKGRRGDTHIYSQLTRFIPRELKAYFDLDHRARPSQPKFVASVRVADIQKAIRGMWE